MQQQRQQLRGGGGLHIRAVDQLFPQKQLRVPGMGLRAATQADPGILRQLPQGVRVLSQGRELPPAHQQLLKRAQRRAPHAAGQRYGRGHQGDIRLAVQQRLGGLLVGIVADAAAHLRVPGLKALEHGQQRPVQGRFAGADIDHAARSIQAQLLLRLG